MMDAYLDALLTQLRLAANPAVEMLEGGALDPLVVGTAIEAACLLQDQPWLSDPDRALADRVLETARRVRPDLAPDAAALESLLDPVRIGSTEDLWLDRIVHLAAVASVLPAAVRERVEVFLDEVRARALTRPALLSVHADEAAVLRDALDLPDHHPVAAVLDDFAETSELVAAAAPSPALAHAVAEARADLGLTGLAAVVRRLEKHFAAAAHWLDAQLAVPAPALAADGDVRPPPERRLLARTPPGELCLVVHDGAALLEWAAEDGSLPRGVEVNGTPLPSAPPLVEDTACWTLRGAGPDIERLTVHLADGQSLDLTSDSPS